MTLQGLLLVIVTAAQMAAPLSNPTSPDQVNVLNFPGVHGDGTQDDTDGLQAAIDTRAGRIYFPAPNKSYLVRRPLLVYSDQELLLDRYASIRLADKADSPLVINADPAGGNRNITIRGGIWDGNNTAQTPHDFSPALPYDPKRFLGVLLRFDHVQNLHLADLTLKNPESFGVQGANLDRFTIENIDFDYNLSRPNMDGIHLNGNCHRGRIANLKGPTNDDMVALNADDGSIAEIARGPITDILIDGLFCENGYTGVRLLSAGSPIQRIRIANLFGSFRYNVVSFTHHNVHPGENSSFEDIVLDGIFCAKPLKPIEQPLPGDAWGRETAPLIWMAPGTHVKYISLRNIHRTENAPKSPDTIVIDENARVDYLAISDASLVLQSQDSPAFLRNAGHIGILNITNLCGIINVGPPRGALIRNLGTIGEKHFLNIDAPQMTAEESKP